ncbi:MAG: hypothetical protein ACKO8Q_04075, partial [Bacteroidota bacterium]
MKKYYVLVALSAFFLSCRQKEINSPCTKIQVLEYGTNTPVPFANIEFYKSNGFGNSPQFELVNLSQVDEFGRLLSCNDDEFDCFIAAVDSENYFIDLGQLRWNTEPNEEVKFLMRTRARVVVSLLDNPNLNYSLHHVEVSVTEGFRNIPQLETLYPNSKEVTLDVFACEDVQIEMKRVYE